jgi:pyruvate formate lyase activating enzyme
MKCDACLQVCPHNAIRTNDRFGKKIDFASCTLCGKCVANCPSRALKIVGKNVSLEDVMREVKKDSIFYRKSGGGVTLSGGEPYAQFNFVTELLKMLKAARISTAVETTGAVPFETMEPGLSNVDLFLYDIKHMNSAIHKQYTGAPNEQILENLRKLDRREKKIWIRVPLIPGINDSTENLAAVFELARSLRNVERIELLPYHNYGVGKYTQLGTTYALEGLKPPSEEHVEAILHMASERFPEQMVIVRRH